MKHCLSVARKMQDIVERNPEKYDISSEDAFLLGFLHDIGYEFAEDQKEHAKVGGLLLKRQNYKYWQEIYYHGFAQKEYDTPELWLLNYVDMITSPTGDYITVRQRIDDIADRYGNDSWQIKESVDLSIMLDANGYNI